MSYFNHEVFRHLVDTLPAKQSLELSQFIIDDNVIGLIQQSVNREQEIVFEDVFLKELFRKVSDAPLGLDTAEIAISGFLQVEEGNIVSNEKIMELAQFIIDAPDSSISRFVRKVRRQIRRILGKAPKDLVPVITIGATVDMKRNRTVFSSLVNPSATFDCVQFLRESGLMRTDYTSSYYPLSDNPGSPFASIIDDIVYVRGGMLDTVPKTALTDRVIVKEATLNIAYQASAGRVISSRLSAFGLHIPDLAEKHKVLARIGSLFGQLATIDLAAASDRIVRELVRLLLPSDWFELLDALRSKRIDIKGQEHELQMFSTAGNGFTFELETLLFYSVALACSLEEGIYLSAPHDVSVFGDDVILPVDYYDNFTKISNILGWVVNSRKSFKIGSFRESCGGDFYKGTNVRGYNAKSLPKTANEWISFTNAIYRVCYCNNGNIWRGRWASDLWHRLISCVPENERLFGPLHYGDSVINCEYSELYTIKYNRWRGESIRVHAPTGGEHTSVGREISEVGVKADLALRLVTHESIRDLGLEYTREAVVNGTYGEDFKNLQSYPQKLLTSTLDIHYRNTWIPYTLFGQAPEELDQLVEGLTSPNAGFLRAPRFVVQRHNAKRYLAMSSLADLLGVISLKKENDARIVRERYESFSLDF